MAEKYIERKYVVLIYKIQTFDECKFKVSDSLIYINISPSGAEAAVYPESGGGGGTGQKGHLSQQTF
jgi:hypothetical protein